MLFNVKQLYTPPLEVYELNERALVLDTETVGAGQTIEIIEIAIGDSEGRILFESLVQPVYNPLPPRSKHQRFAEAEFARAPQWTEIYPAISQLVEGRLLIAYNAAFDRRALASARARHHQDSPERGWRCAMQLVKTLMRARRSPTLEEACAFYGLAGGNHRAARDVEATCALLRAIASAGSPATTNPPAASLESL